MPQSARLSEGEGGCNRYLGNAQIDPAFFSVGLPLWTELGNASNQSCAILLIVAVTIAVETIATRPALAAQVHSFGSKNI